MSPTDRANAHQPEAQARDAQGSNSQGRRARARAAAAAGARVKCLCGARRRRPSLALRVSVSRFGRPCHIARNSASTISNPISTMMTISMNSARNVSARSETIAYTFSIVRSDARCSAPSRRGGTARRASCKLSRDTGPPPASAHCPSARKRRWLPCAVPRVPATARNAFARTGRTFVWLDGSGDRPRSIVRRAARRGSETRAIADWQIRSSATSRRTPDR